MTGVRILVVEDQAIVALDIERKLTKLGYQVVGVVFSGEEAIAHAADACPDLVLMDIKLRGAMDGIEAASEIRERFHIPVIYLTALSDPETMKRALHSHPYGYVVKPFMGKELRQAIELALERHRERRKLRGRG